MGNESNVPPPSSLPDNVPGSVSSSPVVSAPGNVPGSVSSTVSALPIPQQQQLGDVQFSSSIGINLLKPEAVPKVVSAAKSLTHSTDGRKAKKVLGARDEELRLSIMNETSMNEKFRTEAIKNVQERCATYDRIINDQRTSSEERKNAAKELLTAIKLYQINAKEMQLYGQQRNEDDLRFEPNVNQMAFVISSKYGLSLHEYDDILNNLDRLNELQKYMNTNRLQKSELFHNIIEMINISEHLLGRDLDDGLKAYLIELKSRYINMLENETDLDLLAKIAARYKDQMGNIGIHIAGAFNNVDGYAELRELVCNQAKEEINSENCNFLKETSQLNEDYIRRENNMAITLARIEGINKKFINVDAGPNVFQKVNKSAQDHVSSEVNLSSKTKGKFNQDLELLRRYSQSSSPSDREEFNRLASTLFSESRREVMQLVEKDIFPRTFASNSNQLKSSILVFSKLPNA